MCRDEKGQMKKEHKEGAGEGKVAKKSSSVFHE